MIEVRGHRFVSWGSLLEGPLLEGRPYLVVMSLAPAQNSLQVLDIALLNSLSSSVDERALVSRL